MLKKKGKAELIQILATEHSLPLEEIEKMVSSQFKLVRDTMKEGKFEAVRLPFFGVFKAKPGRIASVQGRKLRYATRKTADKG